MRGSVLLTLLFFVFFEGFGAVNVRCDNTSYSGKKLDFYTHADPVSGKSMLLFSLEFDTQGKASATVNITTNTFVFSDFGVYRGIHVLEAGKTSELKLPKFREKNFADQKNPYYTPLTFWIKSANESCLSNQASNFTLRLNELTDKYLSELYFRQSRAVFDSISAQLELEFPVTESDPLGTYKSISLKQVEAEAFRLKPQDYAIFFADLNPEYWFLPAFTELFDKTFGGQLSLEVKSIKGEGIKKAVNSGDIRYLQNHINSDYRLNGAIADLVLLKMLHDAYYSGDFSRNSILQLSRNRVFTNNSNLIIQRTAQNMYDKFNHLRKDTKAPPICLDDINSKNFCSDKSDQKFKYILFIDAETMVNQEHLKYLSKVNQRFEKHLDVILVFRGGTEKSVNSFLTEHKVPGIKLMDRENRVAKIYKIRSFPQCFLLNEKHEVVFDDTKAPLDGFEQQFGEYLQRELFMRQRNQN